MGVRWVGVSNLSVGSTLSVLILNFDSPPYKIIIFHRPHRQVEMVSFTDPAHFPHKNVQFRHSYKITDMKTRTNGLECLFERGGEKLKRPRLPTRRNHVF